MWQLGKAAGEIIAKLCENLNERITRKLRRKLQICQYYSDKEERQKQKSLISNSCCPEAMCKY